MKKVIFFLSILSAFCFGAVFEPVYYFKFNNGLALIHQDGSFDFGADSSGNVFYNSDGSVKNIAGKKISYNNDGSVKRIGGSKVSYDENGKLKKLGGSTLYYDSKGRITRIGNSRITYNKDGTINNISHGLAVIRKSFDPVLSFEIKGKVVIFINKYNEVAFGVAPGGSVFFNKDGRVKSIGGVKFFYNNDGKVRSIGGSTIFYDNYGKIKNFGGKQFSMDKLGRLQYIGNSKITYNKDGKISRTGTGVVSLFQNKKEVKEERNLENLPTLPLIKGKNIKEDNK